MRRVFLIVLDSFGIGELPDSDKYGDKGTNTLKSCFETGLLHVPVMESMGLYNIDGVDFAGNVPTPTACFGKAAEKSKGKDTTTGHWELAGLITSTPFKTYPDGFEKDVIEQFSKATGREVLCNKPYSGTQVLADYGNEHMKTGALIVYTSADSVFQIAAHEAVVPIEELYRYCEIARELCTGKYGVGRIIARPFEGEYPYKRTSRRHDYSLVPPKKTMLNYLSEQGKDVLAVGKINDIFAGKGITDMVRTVDNADGVDKTLAYMDRDFHGICFTNLVDFDMKYGHRNDIDGYGEALTYFDSRLPELLEKLRDEDVLMITADHGCDPSTPSTDHSREYIPWVITGSKIKSVNLGTKDGFGHIGATILEALGVKAEVDGSSVWKEISKK